MRVARYLVVVLAVVASARAAQADTATRDGELREALTEGDLAIELATGVSGYAFAASTAGVEDSSDASAQAVGTVSAGGELRIGEGPCHALTLGGAGHLWSDGETQRESAEHWGSFCILSGLSNWKLGYRLDHQVRTALSAPLRMPRGRIRAGTFEMDIEALDLTLPTQRPVHLVLWAIDADVTALVDSGTWDAYVAVDFAAARLRWGWGPARTSPLELDILAVEAVASGDAFAMQLLPARLAGVRLGALRLAADAGVAMGSVGPYDSMTGTHTYDGGAEAVGELELSASLRPNWTVQASASRRLQPTFEQALVLDHRASLRVEGAFREVRMGVHGFASLSRVDSVAGDTRWEPTYGVGAEGSLRIAPWLRAAATAELARSFYGRDDVMGASTSVAFQSRLGLVASWDTLSP